jgi:hypothetical protein
VKGADKKKIQIQVKKPLELFTRNSADEENAKQMVNIK